MKHKISFSAMKTGGKITDGDERWAKFTGSFVNREIDLFDIADQIYQGYSFTTWHSNQWRASKNFMLGQHIGLDFDTGDERSAIDYLLRDDFIMKYASLIYTTPSHTDAAPKSRVVFLLDRPIMQAANYTSAVISLMWLFSGITVPDRKCKDPCRFFYGSENCAMEFVNKTLTVDLLIHLIKQHAAAGTEQKQRIVKDYKPSNADEQEVQSALSVIPAWGIDYDEWLYCMMALHHHFGDAGLSLAEQWGKGEGEEIVNLWRHLKAGGNGKEPIKISYVFRQARDRGWKWDRQKGERAL